MWASEAHSFIYFWQVRGVRRLQGHNIGQVLCVRVTATGKVGSGGDVKNIWWRKHKCDFFYADQRLLFLCELQVLKITFKIHDYDIAYFLSKCHCVCLVCCLCVIFSGTFFHYSLVITKARDLQSLCPCICIQNIWKFHGCFEETNDCFSQTEKELSTIVHGLQFTGCLG